MQARKVKDSSQLLKRDGSSVGARRGRRRPGTDSLGFWGRTDLTTEQTSAKKRHDLYRPAFQILQKATTSNHTLPPLSHPTLPKAQKGLTAPITPEKSTAVARTLLGGGHRYRY